VQPAGGELPAGGADHPGAGATLLRRPLVLPPAETLQQVHHVQV